MTEKSEKYVLCPRCKKKSLYSTENKFRPFCSERCKIIDLGDWASESYRIPTVENSNESSQDTEENHPTPEDLD